LGQAHKAMTSRGAPVPEGATRRSGSITNGEGLLRYYYRDAA